MADFENIVGYAYVKKAFSDVLSTMEHSEELKKAGVNVPHCLLISGSDHRGKAFMAKEFIKASGRTVFDYSYETTEPDTAEKFMEFFLHPDMKKKYIVNLTDLGSFARENGKDITNIHLVMDEDAKYATGDLFFLATADDPNDLPAEIRDYFQDRICIDLLGLEDTREIYKDLLRKKNIRIGMEDEDVIRMLAIKSYHTMEKILDRAIILECRRNPAALSGESRIVHAESFTDAILNFTFSDGICSGKRDLESLRYAAVHEAGHALAAELLQPGIIGFAALNENPGKENAGGTSLCENWKSTVFNNDGPVIMNLAGKAAVELVYGKDFGGASADIKGGYMQLLSLIRFDGVEGLDLTQPVPSNENLSDGLIGRQEAALFARMEKDFDEAKRLLSENRKALDEIAEALFEKGIVPSSVIRNAIEKGKKA